MGVEVVSVGGVEAVAPAKEVSAKAEVAAVAPGDADVAKNPSFREESNRLGDLKDGERKALAELRAKVEEAIVAGTLFDEEVKVVEAKKKVEPKKKEGKKKAKKAAEEKKEEEAKVEVEVPAEEKKEEEAKEEAPAAAEEKKEEEAKEPEAAEEKKESAEEKKEEAEAEVEKEEAAEEKKEEEPRTEDAAGEGEKVEAAAAVVVVDKDVALWGVPLLPSKGDEATDVVLLKFLRARDFKAGAAFDMLRKTLRWRREWKSLAATAADDGADGAAAMPEGACRLDGADREGHPVCYNALGVFADDAVYRAVLGDDEGKARFLRWRVRAMESHVAELDFRPGGVASLLQVTDLKNSPGPAKKDLRVAMRQVVDLFQDNYPELVARNILINVPFSYYAFSTLFYPFLTQRTKSKFVVARPSKVTETLLKYIPIESIPVKYGGLKCDGDTEFTTAEDAEITEVVVKASSTETIEIEATEGDTTLTWDLTVLGWEVGYKEEFVPSDEGSYTIIIRKGKKMGAAEEAVRNSFRAGEPGKVVITVENATRGKKKVLFRHKTKSSSAKKC